MTYADHGYEITIRGDRDVSIDDHREYHTGGSVPRSADSVSVEDVVTGDSSRLFNCGRCAMGWDCWSDGAPGQRAMVETYIGGTIPPESPMYCSLLGPA